MICNSCLLHQDIHAGGTTCIKIGCTCPRCHPPNAEIICTICKEKVTSVCLLSPDDSASDSFLSQMRLHNKERHALANPSHEQFVMIPISMLIALRKVVSEVRQRQRYFENEIQVNKQHKVIVNIWNADELKLMCDNILKGAEFL